MVLSYVHTSTRHTHTIITITTNIIEYAHILYDCVVHTRCTCYVFPYGEGEKESFVFNEIGIEIGLEIGLWLG